MVIGGIVCVVRKRYSVSGEEVEGMGVEVSFAALIISCDWW